jgi:fucose 4-O-acetylase-like acetyltransferase
MIGVLLCVAKRFSALPALSRLLSMCGEASMLIMFLHQPLQMTLMNTAGLSDKTARFAAATCICILAYRLLSRSAYGRALLLGSASDFREHLLGRSRVESPASPLPRPTAAPACPRSHRAGI